MAGQGVFPQLTVTWEGTAPGLEGHALNLTLWLKALNALVTGLRRTASHLASETAGAEREGAESGRLHRLAKGLDLQLRGIKDNCVTLEFQCVGAQPKGAEPDLFFFDLVDQAAQRFVDGIAAEARGERRHHAARKYLRALPPGVSSQRYQLSSNGQVVRDFLVSETRLAEESRSPPALRRFLGHLAAATFEEGRTSVTIRGVGEKRLTVLQATPAQVDAALPLRGCPVLSMMMISGESRRLVWLRAADSPETVAPPEERTPRLIAEWAKTLEILGR